MAARPVVVVRGLSKDFVLPHERHSSLKQAAVNIMRRPTYERLRVLEDVSFDVQRGEFFGIVGRNGSGKSTLLKILADIYVPTRGEVQVTGRLAPFIELGVGFNAELTGRDNVFLNGAIFGMTRTELLSRYDEIVQYAELGQFMDQKLKNYSNGMQVRLAFSIAIQANADVIIMDEVLAVGDASFQEKCFDTFRALKARGKTIILVTHSMSNVLTFCDRVLVLDRGVTYGVMSAPAASDAYQRLNEQPGWQACDVSLATYESATEDSGSVVVELRDSAGRVRDTFDSQDAISVAIAVPEVPGPGPLLYRVALERVDGLVLSAFESEATGPVELLLTIKSTGLRGGRYRVSVSVPTKAELPPRIVSTLLTVVGREDDALVELPASWVQHSLAPLRRTLHTPAAPDADVLG